MKIELVKPIDSADVDNWLDLYGEPGLGQGCGSNCGLDW